VPALVNFVTEKRAYKGTKKGVCRCAARCNKKVKLSCLLVKHVILAYFRGCKKSLLDNLLAFLDKQFPVFAEKSHSIPPMFYYKTYKTSNFNTSVITYLSQPSFPWN